MRQSEAGRREAWQAGRAVRGEAGLRSGEAASGEARWGEAVQGEAGLGWLRRGVAGKARWGGATGAWQARLGGSRRGAARWGDAGRG